MTMMLSVIDVVEVHGKVEFAYEFAVAAAEFVVIVVETKKLQMLMVVVVEYWA
jgi:hypothetical protein